MGHLGNGGSGAGEIGVVYSTLDLLAQNCSAVILFDADPDVWELVCASSGPVVLE